MEQESERWQRRTDVWIRERLITLFPFSAAEREGLGMDGVADPGPLHHVRRIFMRTRGAAAVAVACSLPFCGCD